MTSTASETHTECAAWCEFTNDPEGHILDDGTCLGGELRTTLSIPQCDPDDLPPGVADFITAYLQRQPGRPDVIVVAHGQLVGIELTSDEAREHIEHLQLLLGQIGAGR